MIETRLFVAIAETPVHAGTGAELGAVDLPIQRERHTELPTIHGSGLKGVLRATCEAKHGKDVTKALFGSKPPQPGQPEELEAGAIAVGDARLLLFPVRTVGPVFAWVTSPYCLARLRRDLEEIRSEDAAKVPTRPVAETKAMVPEGNGFGKAVVLEEYELEPQASGEVKTLAAFLQGLLPSGRGMEFWQKLLGEALVVVADDLLRDFCRHATEVVTRVRLDSEKKTVEKGALWTEEYLPADSVMYSVIGLASNRVSLEAPWRKVQDLCGPLQIGGKETIGRGFLRTRLWPEEGK